MLQFVRLFTVLLLLTSCGLTKRPTVNAAVDQDAAARWIETHLQPAHTLQGAPRWLSIPRVMLDDGIPGLSMAFVDQGQIAWTRSYGYANLQTGEEVTPATVFAGASFSKPLTAMAALSLVEAGVLNLDAAVNPRLQGWTVPDNELTVTEAVTLRRLLAHRAGIANDLWSSYLPGEPTPTIAQALAGEPPSIDPATRVISVPGSAESYSNPGYSIIQKLLEDVTGTGFDQILEARVLKPNGMHDTSFRQPMPTSLKQRRATGYSDDLQPYPYRLFPFKAAGGVWTTASDMARFMGSVLSALEGQETVLSQSMAEQVVSRNRERLAFSKIFAGQDQDVIFRHYGSNQGFTCYMLGSVNNKQAVVLMSNSDNGFELLDYVARAVADYYKWDHLRSESYAPYPLTKLELDQYVGAFAKESATLRFHREEDGLWLTEMANSKAMRLVPVGATEFISEVNYAKYQFYRPRGVDTGEYEWVRTISPSGRDSWSEKSAEEAG